jgi:glycosyltransferase involved in cell wall biosynthesis
VGSAPEIAVVIGAYRRREYLLRAVRSVLAQTVSRDRFEIFVTKDFTDPVIDEELAREGIASVVDADPRIGTWLGRAARATHAPILTFLDDDDEYEPDRLARILEVLRDHPEVGFYRNRVRVIDAGSQPIPPERWRKIETDGAFDTSGPVVFAATQRAGLVEFAFLTTRTTFNSSTMALRRSLFDGPTADLFARTQLPDLGLFLAGALGSSALYFDDRRLTRYRFYGGNVTHRVAWLAEAARCHQEAADRAASLGQVELASWLREGAVHYERMYRAGRVMDQIGAQDSRGAVARLSAEYLRFLGRHPSERAARLDVWAAEVYGLAYCVAPSFARQMRAARRPVHLEGTS